MAADIWDLVRKYIPAKERKAVAERIVAIFENEDCDTMDEADQLMKDAGLDKRWEDE